MRKSGIKEQFPASLVGKVEKILTHRNASLDSLRFKELKQYRDDLTHPQVPIQSSPEPDVTQLHFDFCVEHCRVLYSRKLMF